MHRDLNCMKGTVKVMVEMWMKLGKTPPKILANKDNAAVLANWSSGGEASAAKKQAEEVSKRGGVHATTLGGMLFKNKDTKKGQQDTYVWYMEKHIGHHVPYPDVSNTWYGSHGEAATTILVYLAHLLSFMHAIMWKTNLEKRILKKTFQQLSKTYLPSWNFVFLPYTTVLSLNLSWHMSGHTIIS